MPWCRRSFSGTRFAFLATFPARFIHLDLCAAQTLLAACVLSTGSSLPGACAGDSKPRNASAVWNSVSAPRGNSDFGRDAPVRTLSLRARKPPGELSAGVHQVSRRLPPALRFSAPSVRLFPPFSVAPFLPLAPFRPPVALEARVVAVNLFSLSVFAPPPPCPAFSPRVVPVTRRGLTLFDGCLRLDPLPRQLDTP